MKTITMTNDFHNTSVTFRIDELEGVVIGKLSAGQAKRARRELCGISGCTCGDALGRRGPQENEIEPLFDSWTGYVSGALVYAK